MSEQAAEMSANSNITESGRTTTSPLGALLRHASTVPPNGPPWTHSDGGFTCPTSCVEENHPGREHEQWITEVEAKGEVDPAMCACGHGLHLHDPEADPSLCEVCGDNTNCNYADLRTISADRWDEGWIAAMNAVTPAPIKGAARVLWALDHMPEDNPYRDEPVGTADRMRRKFAEFVRHTPSD